MTEFQTEFYLLLCMSGRTEEAIEYKEKCERENLEHEIETEDTER